MEPEPLLVGIAEAVRKYYYDTERVKVTLNDIEYYLSKYDEKVNIQRICPKSGTTEHGWWLLPDNIVKHYMYDDM